MSKRKTITRVVFAAISLVLVLVMVYSGLQILESTVFHVEQTATKPVASKTITRNGTDYFPRQDITAILISGIDAEGTAKDSGIHRNEGAADMVALAILDQKEETITILNLNRDTMLQMHALGIDGSRADTVYGQLALAHTYGNGLVESSENLRDTVSDYLYGITIDHYVTLYMDGIAILNDSVGGVTVQVTEDFSAVDPSIIMGELTLRGDQAETYVRSRSHVGDQLNTSRMERHKGYMEGLLTALKQSMEASDLFIAETFEKLSEYMITDCSVNVVSGLMERCSDYALKEIVTPEGEYILGETHYEFYAEDAALDALILRLFYAPKE